ncbi:MAG TPA: response regulator [Gemmatimonadales bacterium]|nr:response regulator [Gemmatimonadales bacterium]
MTRPAGYGVPGGGESRAVPTVAVIDDEPGVRRSIERVLRSVGLAVVGFASGEQFLALCRTEGVSCLVLDVHLAGMSGIELHDALRKAGVVTPVVLITGHDDAGTLEAVRASGVRCLHKPVEARELLATVAEAMASRH